MHSDTALDLAFRALGDRTRRSMIQELAAHEWRSAGELGERFDSAQPTISKHLKVLEQANLIERAVDGRVHRFRLRRNTLRIANEWLERHQRFWAGAVDQLESLLMEPKK